MLKGDNEKLLGERNRLHEAVLKLGRQNEELQLRASRYQERLSDIPLPEVMERMGYRADQNAAGGAIGPV